MVDHNMMMMMMMSTKYVHRTATIRFKTYLSVHCDSKFTGNDAVCNRRNTLR